MLIVGALATNVIGRRLLQRGDQVLLHVPLFRTIYAPVKQFISAFSPDSESGFKRMVLVEDPARGFVLGFLTKEFVVDRGRGPERSWPSTCRQITSIWATSWCVRRIACMFPDMTVEEGVRVFLTGGMGLPEHIRADRDMD